MSVLGRHGATADRAHYVFKTVVIGDSGCGKSSLLNRYAENIFADGSIPATVGPAFKSKIVRLEATEEGEEEQLIRLQLWDTAGQERYNAMTSNYMRGSHIVILVFSLTNRDSYLNVSKWFDLLLNSSVLTECVFLLVANKLDLVTEDPSLRQVSTHEIIEYAKANGMFCFETSAKSGHQVEIAIDHAAKQCAKRFFPATLQPKPSNPFVSSSTTVQLSPEDPLPTSQEQSAPNKCKC